MVLYNKILMDANTMINEIKKYMTNNKSTFREIPNTDVEFIYDMLIKNEYGENFVAGSIVHQYYCFKLLCDKEYKKFDKEARIAVENNNSVVMNYLGYYYYVV